MTFEALIGDNGTDLVRKGDQFFGRGISMNRHGRGHGHGQQDGAGQHHSGVMESYSVLFSPPRD